MEIWNECWALVRTNITSLWTHSSADVATRVNSWPKNRNIACFWPLAVCKSDLVNIVCIFLINRFWLVGSAPPLAPFLFWLRVLMWKKQNFPVALQMEMYVRHTSECYQKSLRKKSEVGDATLDWLWSTNKLNSFYDRNTDGPSTPLLLLSLLSFSFSVSLCQVLNNLGAELVIFSN